ncbi:MAG: asparaginase domain-containing protein [Patescibacteria group bacterium]
MAMNLNAESRPESNERIKPVEVSFFKLGGTWDMIFKDGQKIGTGNIDDDALKEMQKDAGYFSDDPEEVIVADRKLALALYDRFQRTEPVKLDVGEHLSSWAHTIPDLFLGNEIKDFIHGPFVPLFSGDSSHLESQITAPLIATLIQHAIREPNKPLLGGQGTDTADMALLQLYDAFTFDTELPPLILAGSNRSHVEEHSDAPENFLDMARLANKNLPPGAYWVFQGNLYPASDVMKIDPLEDRPVEGQTTFHSPHRHNFPMTSALKQYEPADWGARKAPSPEHVARKITVENLYDALESIYNPDLGKKDSISRIVIPGIRNPKNKAVVLAAHSLGNTGNGVRHACIKEVLAGKLIAGISRTLIGATNEEYAASLFGANHNPEELDGTGKMIIHGHKLNSSVANALMARALLENLTQAQAQELFTTYAQSRGLA